MHAAVCHKVCYPKYLQEFMNGFKLDVDDFYMDYMSLD